jgi:hypothetical protein
MPSVFLMLLQSWSSVLCFFWDAARRRRTWRVGFLAGSWASVCVLDGEVVGIVIAVLLYASGT